MLAIGTIELISCLVTNHYCKRMPRKLWIILVMCVSGAFGVLVQLTGATEALELVFIGLSRLLNTVGFALFSLICS